MSEIEFAKLEKFLTLKQRAWIVSWAVKKGHNVKTLRGAWPHLSPGQQKMVVVNMAGKRGYVPLQGGFFGKLFKSVIKPLGKALLPAAMDIGKKVISDQINKKLSGKGRKVTGGCVACPVKRKRKVQGGALRLSGRGVSQF